MAQVSGILVTVVLALTTGLVAGVLIKATGSKGLLYEDSDEFCDACLAEERSKNAVG
jgi:ammonium transporter Rh